MADLIANRFEILSKLGEGGQGTVFKARHVELDHVVALKSLPTHLASDPDLLGRFRREAKVQARFKHPRIVRVTDIVSEAGQFYLVMDYVEGQDLRRHLRAHGALSIPQALEIASQVGDALAYAHDRQVVHRDIKPSNILVESIEPVEVMLFDFGIAKEEDSTDSTRTGALVGSYRYSSPEQLGYRRSGRRGEPISIDGRTDIYALGLVLYEMIEGKGLFAGYQEPDVIGRVVYDPTPIEPEFTRPVPSPVVELLGRTFQRDPEQRVPSMREFVRTLRRFQLEPWGRPEEGSAPGSAQPTAAVPVTTGPEQSVETRSASPIPDATVFTRTVAVGPAPTDPQARGRGEASEAGSGRGPGQIGSPDTRSRGRDTSGGFSRGDESVPGTSGSTGEAVSAGEQRARLLRARSEAEDARAAAVRVGAESLARALLHRGDEAMRLAVRHADAGEPGRARDGLDHARSLYTEAAKESAVRASRRRDPAAPVAGAKPAGPAGNAADKAPTARPSDSGRALEAARSKAEEARRAAEQARAPDLAPAAFAEGATLEAGAQHLAESGVDAQAVRSYRDAAEAFIDARRTAEREAELLRAREALEHATASLTTAIEADAETLLPEEFATARNNLDDGRSLLDAGLVGRSLAPLENAATLARELLERVRGILEERERLEREAARVETAREAAAGKRARAEEAGAAEFARDTFERALGEQREGVRAAQAGRPGDAAAAFERAADGFDEAGAEAGRERTRRAAERARFEAAVRRAREAGEAARAARGLALELGVAELSASTLERADDLLARADAELAQKPARPEAAIEYYESARGDYVESRARAQDLREQARRREAEERRRARAEEARRRREEERARATDAYERLVRAEARARETGAPELAPELFQVASGLAREARQAFEGERFSEAAPACERAAREMSEAAARARKEEEARKRAEAERADRARKEEEARKRVVAEDATRKRAVPPSAPPTGDGADATIATDRTVAADDRAGRAKRKATDRRYDAQQAAPDAGAEDRTIAARGDRSQPGRESRRAPERPPPAPSSDGESDRAKVALPPSTPPSDDRPPQVPARKGMIAAIAAAALLAGGALWLTSRRSGGPVGRQQGPTPEPIASVHPGPAAPVGSAPVPTTGLTQPSPATQPSAVPAPFPTTVVTARPEPGPATVPKAVPSVVPSTAPAPTATVRAAEPSPSPKPTARLAWQRVLPEGSAAATTEDEAIVFEAAVEKVEGPGQPKLRWLVDGKQRSEGSSFRYQPTFSESGERRVTAVASLGSASIERSWTVSVEDVNRPPAISKAKPASASVRIDEGGRQEFQVVASDPDPKDTLTFSWRRNDQPVPDARTSTWVLEGATPADREVSVSVADATGAVAEARTWTLSVEKPAPTADLPPKIAAQEPGARSLRVAEGEAVDLRVRLAPPVRDADVTQTWFLDGKQVAQGDRWHYGAPASLERPTESHRIEFEAVSKSGLKAPRVGWDLEVVWAPPVIEKASPRSTSLSVVAGKSLDFEVTARTRGSATGLRYAWSVDSKPLPVSSDSSLSLPSDLAPGAHQVEVAALDTRSLRSTPRTWSVSVLPEATPTPTPPLATPRPTAPEPRDTATPKATAPAPTAKLSVTPSGVSARSAEGKIREWLQQLQGATNANDADTVVRLRRLGPDESARLRRAFQQSEAQRADGRGPATVQFTNIRVSAAGEAEFVANYTKTDTWADQFGNQQVQSTEKAQRFRIVGEDIVPVGR